LVRGKIGWKHTKKYLCIPTKQQDEEYATCEWEANYTFSGTGRRVVNKVKAHMRLRDGFIIEHSDSFDMYKWCRQALGWKGWLLGWSGFLQNRVRRQAFVSLEKYMLKN